MAALSRAAIGSECRFAAGMHAARASASSLALARSRDAVIGLDNARHQFMADHIFMGECDMADVFNPCKQLDRFRQSGRLAGWQVDLAWVARDDHAAVLA